ncbi:hypothetical protein CC78DRAFT_536290 [Lojkania enalia]|uniref:Uncharacterized protein n=1 Tax=Lojkania enalia TaxID=147567 RepID=A0A9P4MWV9_9PLEO|nr:hypothetical protein CC78DRAFT_536290 [Didymosphaeria enalia]
MGPWRWQFPAATKDNTHIQHADESITTFLKFAANKKPSDGFGSIALHPKDTIDLRYLESESSTDTYQIEHWCLQCFDEAIPTDPWMACDSYKQKNATKLYKYELERSKPGPYRLPELQDYGIPAICTFGIKDSNPYELTIAYLFVNSAPDNGVNLDWSSTGTKVSNVPTISSYPSSTRTIPFGQSLDRRSYFDFYEQRDKTATIVGAVVGTIVGIIILGCMISCYTEARSKKRKQEIAMGIRPATIHVVPYGSARTNETPQPMVQDRLSRAEEGRARPRRRDTDGESLAPPAYEEAVADAARRPESQEGARQVEEVDGAIFSAQIGEGERQLPPLPQLAPLHQNATGDDNQDPRRTHSW